MSEESSTTNSRSPNQRHLSDFICKEMLYDFATGQLDPDRNKAMQESLEKNLEAKKELESLLEAMSYCDQLSKTEVSDSLSQLIKEGGSVWLQKLQKYSWGHWPEFLRWGSEALAISVLVALIAVVIPWDKVRDMLPQTNKNTVVLAEVEQEKVETENSEAAEEAVTGPAQPIEPTGKPLTALADNESSQQKAEDTTPAAQEVSAAKNEKGTVGTAEETTKDGSAVEGTQESQVSGAVATTAVTEKPKPVEKVKPKLKGILYRGFMELENIDVVTELIIAEMKKLGALKAGKVKLGWKKPNGSYFHFSLPESNHDQLLQSLRHFGPVRIYKHPHWRVMPEGNIRFIIWIEDLDLKNKKQDNNTQIQ